ncbi:hypothetical protein RFI_02147 [Reticulomyxa filosa]|uniref:Uncharacterized protein n=1 Tax=Reticulomyxa filosa TaxID=46433 RepID=X6PBA5_RETFI|nr:hypothetical protein RFI_02147 [Reticulomyxa filosa]|eukprot:ETO34927.1 hypothetical protein RFI_02147 [Reticulomyxa filosa]
MRTTFGCGHPYPCSHHYQLGNNQYFESDNTRMDELNGRWATTPSNIYFNKEQRGSTSLIKQEQLFISTMDANQGVLDYDIINSHNHNASATLSHSSNTDERVFHLLPQSLWDMVNNSIHFFELYIYMYTCNYFHFFFFFFLYSFFDWLSYMIGRKKKKTPDNGNKSKEIAAKAQTPASLRIDRPHNTRDSSKMPQQVKLEPYSNSHNYHENAVSNHWSKGQCQHNQANCRATPAPNNAFNNSNAKHVRHDRSTQPKKTKRKE